MTDKDKAPDEKPADDDKNAKARAVERDLFARLARVKQYPISPDE